MAELLGLACQRWLAAYPSSRPAAGAGLVARPPCGQLRDPAASKDQAQLLLQARVGGHGLYSSVVERQSCKLKVLGSIPSEGSFGPPFAVAQAGGPRTDAGSPGMRARTRTRAPGPYL